MSFKVKATATFGQMDKKELTRLTKQILGMKKNMFAAVDDERYEEAAFLLDLIKRQQKRMVKKLQW